MIRVDPGRWSNVTLGALAAAGLDETNVAAVVSRALAEDFADGPDVTTAATVPADAIAEAAITPRQWGVLAGGPVALAVFDSVLGAATFTAELQPDGSALSSPVNRQSLCAAGRPASSPPNGPHSTC